MTQGAASERSLRSSIAGSCVLQTSMRKNCTHRPPLGVAEQCDRWDRQERRGRPAGWKTAARENTPSIPYAPRGTTDLRTHTPARRPSTAPLRDGARADGCAASGPWHSVCVCAGWAHAACGGVLHRWGERSRRTRRRGAGHAGRLPLSSCNSMLSCFLAIFSCDSLLAPSLNSCACSTCPTYPRRPPARCGEEVHPVCDATTGASLESWRAWRSGAHTHSIRTHGHVLNHEKARLDYSVISLVSRP